MTDQTTVLMPPETKKRVRLVAAELNLPMGKTAQRLIEIGLDEYKKNAMYLDPSPAPMMGAQKEASSA